MAVQCSLNSTPRMLKNMQPAFGKIKHRPQMAKIIGKMSSNDRLSNMTENRKATRVFLKHGELDHQTLSTRVFFIPGGAWSLIISFGIRAGRKIMEIIREGLSASHPPILDDKNYSSWKPRMIFFIKTLDRKAWRALMAGYDPPMITVNGVSVPKPEVDWTDAEEQASVGNVRALDAIFNGLDLNIFKLINSCSTAKEAWKTLEVAYEGTFKVKISRLQLITSKFEALRMIEDESVSDYNKRVLEIARILAARRNNENSDRRSDGYLKKKEDEESVDSRVDDGNINAFTVRITDENTDDDSECSVESKNDELSIEKLETLWKEDCEARAIQKERIQDLLEENELLMSVISSLKYGLGFVASASSSKATSEIKFVPASVRVEYDTIHKETGIRTLVKSLGRTSYYYDDAWYFDSGCSKHMTRNRSYFTNLNDYVTEHVTFGDGAKGKIIAKGNIDKDDLSRLNDVRYVDGLKENLISISQLCDQGYKVSFDDIGCVSLGTVTMDLMGPMQTESLGVDREYRQKWDARSEQGIFLVYSQNSRAYRVYNNRSDSVMQTINVVINYLDSDIKQMNDEEDDTPNMYEVRTTSTVEESKADKSSDGPGKR
ncbi:gag-pol polyprotein [Cucumis melo var. makuwa]|uniref:Gag-pol polyprotein n=1 Tax=Cucumis melo var. makuwa TaxID=1194695 RepID=A0A5A7TK22_CUCMM|nr:gag-pol polyprotein [Cucumis melo var. makuwa]